MKDYIKREDAKKLHCDICMETYICYCRGNCSTVEEFDNISKADVRENVHAHWIDTGSGEECSACKEIQYGYDSGRRFCANCGAIMDGKIQ